MKWWIYPLRPTRQGRKPGEFPVGSIGWAPGLGLDLEVPDPGLAAWLREHLGRPLQVRQCLGSPGQGWGHRWIALAPGGEEHLQEALRRLHRVGFVAVPCEPEG